MVLYTYTCEFKDWIEQYAISKNIDSSTLFTSNIICQNPNAMEFLKKHPEKINWYVLSRNYDLIEILKLNHNDINIDWWTVSTNPHPETIPLLLKNPNKICWQSLATNTNKKAVELLEKNPEKIDWMYLSGNPPAINLLHQNLTKIDLRELWGLLSNPNITIELFEKYNKMQKMHNNISLLRYKSSSTYMLNVNPNAIPILKKYPEKINYKVFSTNPNAMELLELFEEKAKQNPEELNWYVLSKNPNAILLLQQYPEKIDWCGLSLNTHPIAIEMLEKNPEKINWKYLSLNVCAIHLLEKNPEKIHWENLSLNLNPNAMSILKQYPEKVNWNMLGKNPNIFKIRFNNEIYKELMEVVYHPRRFTKYLFEYNYDMGCDEYTSSY
jgi:hypothetical protein